MFLSLLLKRLLICLVCHRITKMKLKLVNLFSFSINVLLSFSFLPQKGSLMKLPRLRQADACAPAVTIHFLLLTCFSQHEPSPEAAKQSRYVSNNFNTLFKTVKSLTREVCTNTVSVKMFPFFCIWLCA